VFEANIRTLTSVLQMADHGADESAANSSDSDPSRSNPPDEVDDCCPICSDTMTSPSRTACGHVFCSACLVHAFQMKRPWNRGPCPLCRAAASVYSTVSIRTGEPLEVPEVTTIFGSVYLQGDGTRHSDSPDLRYHFESHDLCYISYSFAPEDWTLGDGSRAQEQQLLHERKLFEGCQYDAATRTFRATVRATDDVPFWGIVRWEYRMVFSDDFCIIVDGEVISFDVSGNRTSIDRYPHDLRYWRYRDPPTRLLGCAFMQGGSLGLASYHFPVDAGVEGAYISYEAAPPSWFLDNGQPPPRRKPFVNPTFDEGTRTFRGTIDWSEAAFGGDVRWDYAMVFAEDYSHIVGGGVTCYTDVDLPPSMQAAYGQELIYELYVEEEAQMMYCLKQLRIGAV